MRQKDEDRKRERSCEGQQKRENETEAYRIVYC